MIVRHLLTSLAVLGLSVSPAAAQDEAAPVAATQYGDVRGLMDDGVAVFRGIRYGADTSDRRFQPALPPMPWADVKDATSWGDAIPQPQLTTALFSDWAPVPDEGTSEDVLFLNVWTPAVDDESRPVMVWFHGGGFTSGSGAARVYDGVNLAQRGDVVLVTVNHRLNAFGYLDLDGMGDAYADSANVGSLDMVMALEWVRDNIAGFGGDPETVTIFGESGGGGKVFNLMAIPAAEGLFDRAIVQSGSQFNTKTQEEVAAARDRLMAELGVEDVAGLEAASAEGIIAAIEALEERGEGMAFGYSYDSRNVVREPGAADVPSPTVPLLMGTTKDEMRLFLAADPSVFTIGFGDLPARLAPFMGSSEAAALTAAYRMLMPEASAFEILAAIASDLTFRRGAVLAAKRRAAEEGAAPVWLYQLDWGSPVMGGALGAMHALDLAFMFDNTEYSQSIAGDPAANQPIADQMSEAWIAFARTGNPNTDRLPDWPAFTAETRQVMHFDTDPQVHAGYFAAQEQIYRTAPEPR
ncbi:MAG: carboxylesterase family protein [Pacificimonas sp.]